MTESSTNPLRFTALEEAIDKIYEQIKHETAEPPREYLGASQIGKECDRLLWLQFRHAFSEKISGRMQRLFDRGKHEEFVFSDLLQLVGCRLEHAMDDQLWVDMVPFVGGHPDGIITEGLPGAEKTKHIVEMKTHNLKSFSDLCARGVQASKPEHFTQMQLYCYALGIKRWLYIAVCKDTDELYCERGALDEDHARSQLERATRIIMADRAPVPMHTDPAYYKCKWCPANDICHGKKTIAPEQISCHTCAYATPAEDAHWHCTLYGGDVIPDPSKEYPCHVIHPDMALCWQVKDTGNAGELGYIIGNGNLVVNGGSGRTTRDILTDPALKLANDFDGRVC